MPLIVLKCPQCSADIDFDESRDLMFCKYCGTKILREQVNVINQITKDAQYYFDTWIQLRERLKENPVDYRTRKAFDEIDIEFTKLYCNDYRRAYADALALTSDFLPRTTYEDDRDYDGCVTDTIKTYVNIGGLGAEEQLKRLREKIATSDSEQAQLMLKKLDSHISQLELVNSEIIPGHYPKNVIKVVKKKKGIFKLF